ncbi:MAG TPA: cell division topological specificity factor MinE [Candidatus Ventrimonas merdavium]|mgnify:CR=1 FL=1|nr:cell division topological specificity factor MinE [Candidatus Ventrimonas merdavium]
MRQLFRMPKSNSGEIARSRLKLLLVSDKAHVNPGLVSLIRDDMILVLSRYAQVDSGRLELRLTRMNDGAGEGIPALSATFPIRELTGKRTEECFSTLR